METTAITWAADHREAYATVTSVVRDNLPQGRTIDVVEAGCGRAWVLGPIADDVRIAGIDLDAEALRVRVEETRDLDVAIHGDLMTVEVGDGSVDLVFSCYVLEHLEQPDVALDRFFDWLRPGGLCALIIPDRDTAKGFATRFSPYLVHVWYYRWVKGYRTAGKPGHVPYRTFYKRVVCRKGLRAYAEARGHKVVAEVPIRMQRADDGVLTTVASRIIKVLSLGRYRDDYCNFALVMAKSDSSP